MGAAAYLAPIKKIPVAVALAATVVALAPATSPASSVAVEGAVLRVTASPGEANSVEVASGVAGSVTVSDLGAPPAPGSGCLAAGPGSLTCSGAASVDAELGDGDDSFALSAPLGATVDGGEGADRLVLRDGETDTAWCGGGRDTVQADALDELDLACERVDYGPPGQVGRPRPIRGGGRFVAIPGQTWALVDRRIVADVLDLVRRYHVRVGDGYAVIGHEPLGEHPLGLAVDLYPGPGGSWRDVARLAKWAEPRQNHPRRPFRWVGWNGDFFHGDPQHCQVARGCPAHLHLSWAHSPGRPGHPVRTVWVFSRRT
jgi:hypothetical protein